jgi:site-specific recombinase XerD
MKQKIAMVIEAETMRLAKQKAAEERRPLGDLVQQALTQYLRKDALTAKERKMAYQFFCERPMKIPLRQLRHILKEDMWSP